MAVTPSDIAKAAQAINRHRTLTASARRVALEIISALNKQTATAWRSVGGLAKRLGLSHRTVGYALQQLRDLKLITSKRNGGRGLLFRLAWRRLRSMAAAFARIKALPRNARTAAQALVASEKPKAIRQAVAHVSTYSRNYIGAKKQKQILSDQQLNAKAHGRLYQAIQSLLPHQMASLFDRMSPEIEEQAVRAERYHPNNGITGLQTLKTLLGGASA